VLLKLERPVFARIATLTDWPMILIDLLTEEGIVGRSYLEGAVTANRACALACGSVAKGMKKISYKGYRFPAEIIQQAIWLYLRFTLSFRDVEDLLAERGIAVTYETVRRWVNHFGPMIAADLRRRRPKPHTTWHLDEVYLKIDGRMAYLWRAVDAEGEVLDVLVQSKRNKRAALNLCASF
jgi:transposase-like protein